MNKKSSNKAPENTEYPCIQHASFGKYNVYDKNKNLLTDKPIKKNEAEKLLSEILAQNQTHNDGNDDKNDEKSGSSDLNSANV